MSASTATPRLMIMAGGTGGHIFPGLAVADALKAKGWEVTWLGTRSGMEAELVPQRGYPIDLLAFSGMRGKGALHALTGGFRLLHAFWQSIGFLRARRPTVVLGMGGYPSLPGGMMASLLNIPLAVHNLDARPGLANRLLAPLADKICVAFDGLFPKYAAKVVRTGSPIRADIAMLAPPAERFAGRSGPLRVLVFGGSLGAQALNRIVPEALKQIPAEQRPRVVHQSGQKHFADLQRAYAEQGVEAELLPFIDDMAARYAWADLAICRSGAITVAELAAAGLPALLIPFPQAADDHQTDNAKAMEAAGAAWHAPQQCLTVAGLAEFLQNTHRDKLVTMAESARAIGEPEATAKVVAVIEALARQ